MEGQGVALLGCAVIGTVMLVVTVGRALAGSIRDITKWERRNR